MAGPAEEFKRWGFLACVDYENWPADKVAATLASQGYNAVEWSLAHFDPRRMSAAELAGVITMSRDKGLEVSAVTVQQDLVCLDAEVLDERIALSIDAAAAAVQSGVKVVNVLTGPNRWEDGHVDVGAKLAEGKAWGIMLDAYERMLDGFAEVGAEAALEPCWGGLAHDFHSTGVLLRRFGTHPAFAINFDPSHFALVRDDINWVIRELAPYIRHVHIKDVAGTPGHEGREFIFPLIGEGRVNWSEMFNALDAVGYRGFMSVEFEAYRYYSAILKNDPGKASEISMQQLRALEAYMPEGLLK
ncbi:sugar phosphate isomerase/epimerase [Hoeflea sp. G2-23]|uniref:Sugar phosphate isomerase/epimerase n=1 Tax=Hoeflea algicola TaxID=2983763 RepID=A0ABT3ZCZ9_9HYPH|nr:sugar phosphate isomerase/epimerase family protein [Hoeflea algicola]MCY0149657.1 sugar phosphate isomerase/epimerase [Hoeflea algicola]